MAGEGRKGVVGTEAGIGDNDGPFECEDNFVVPVEATVDGNGRGYARGA